MRICEIALDETLADWQGGDWVHYSKQPFLKINPQPFHQDPAGIYLFPASFKMNGHWKSHPYKFRVTLKPDIRVLDFGALDIAGVKQFADKLGLLDKLAATIHQYRDFETFDPTKPKALLGVIWHIVRSELHGFRAWAKLNKTFRDLGYDAIFDDTGTIHSAEVQMLVLDPRVIASAKLDVQKPNAFANVTKVFKDVHDLAQQYGTLDITAPRRQKHRYDNGFDLEGKIHIANPNNDKNYAYFYVTWENERPHQVNVSLRYSSPALGYGSGALYNISQQEYDSPLSNLNRDLTKVFSQNGT